MLWCSTQPFSEDEALMSHVGSIVVDSFLRIVFDWRSCILKALLLCWGKLIPDDWSVLKYKGLDPLLLFGTILWGHPRFWAHCGIGWGLCHNCTTVQLLYLSKYASLTHLRVNTESTFTDKTAQHKLTSQGLFPSFWRYKPLSQALLWGSKAS